ncbi:MAG TPA: class I SAM-dependent DNA methyltransferase [Pyrinomonadaceae bacterium]|nr:class I SAM-dependent DNA methyltransferase [Pyrinomonadaceae bacterium]
MITGELKSKVDSVWNAFATGGIANPLEVIEQITYLLFIKRLDDLHTAKERKAGILNKPIENPLFTEEEKDLRWSKFKHAPPQEMFETVDKKVFPFIKTFRGQETTYSEFMQNARLSIPTAGLLAKVVDLIDKIPMHDRDTKGDVYEYMLGKIAQAGRNGQFRTPRHIIGMMVEMLAPKPTDIVCDPACGTAGFLVAANEYLLENHGREIFSDDNLKKHFYNGLFNGFDFDNTMLRIGAMNMMLHGIENPNIRYRDSLAEKFAADEEMYSVILANPPFKGSLDYESTAKDLLRTVKTRKTELLFIALFLRLLKTGGRAAVIVPDGVLFGSSTAHLTLRKTLVESQKLDAVVSMPSGVFKPYAGVSTAALIFTKTNSGGTENVWFYDMQADGFSLDDKRAKLDGAKHENNNIPDILARWRNPANEAERTRTEQSFLVPKTEIAANGYDLSINRYKEIVYEEINHDSPKVILEELNKLETEIQADLKALEAMIA